MEGREGVEEGGEGGGEGGNSLVGKVPNRETNLLPFLLFFDLPSTFLPFFFPVQRRSRNSLERGDSSG